MFGRTLLLNLVELGSVRVMTQANTDRAMTVRAHAIAAAGRILALARRDLLEYSPRESAQAAHVPGGPSVDDLEQRIIARLGLAQAA
jgi:hypothetical protein